MSTANDTPMFRSKRFPTKMVIAIAVALMLVVGGGYALVRTFTKSEGTRSGLLFKISRSGYVFKTYEGQLHLGGSAMMTAQSVWNFSIKDKAVYEELQKYEGAQVKLHYRQLVDAFIWQGNTDYIVYKVEPGPALPR